MVMWGFYLIDKPFHTVWLLLALFDFFVFISRGFVIFGFFLKLIHMCSSFFYLDVGEFD
jgi:hypothetical protein